MTQTIVLDQLNSVTFLLSGIVVGPPGVSCSPSCGALTYASLPADGATHSFGFTFTFYDEDGNPITGSAPFSSPVAVSLVESGGSGHMQLLLNGTPSGTSVNLTYPTDNLAVKYDGGGAAGYTSTITIGGATVQISPMFIAPAGLTINTNTSTNTPAITENGAPSATAYSASTACAQITSTSVTGTGASATLNVSTSAPQGETESCTVQVTDVYGTTYNYPVTFAVYGPITAGSVTFTGGGQGSCSSSIQFGAANQTAGFTLSDPGFPGTYTVSNPTPAVASASVSGANVTITALTAGTTTVTFGDGSGNVLTCPVGVTITGGSVQ